MPHLAPMSWAVASLIFWVLLLMFMTTLWWSQTPKFTSSSADAPKSAFSTWNWS